MLEAEARARFPTKHRPAPFIEGAGIALTLAMPMAMAATWRRRWCGPASLASLARRRLRSPPAAITIGGVVDGLAKVRAEGTHWKIVRTLTPRVRKRIRRSVPWEGRERPCERDQARDCARHDNVSWLRPT